MRISGFSRKKERVSSANVATFELLQNCIVNGTDGCKTFSWDMLNYYHVMSSVFSFFCEYGDEKDVGKEKKINV